MHSDHVVVLAQRTTAYSTQFLHVPTDTEQEAEVHTERTNIGARLTRYPEDSEVTLLVELKKIRLVNGTYPKLTLHGGDEWWTLEERTGEGLDGAGECGGVGEC